MVVEDDPSADRRLTPADVDLVKREMVNAFIYATRLSHIFDIDLAYATICKKEGLEFSRLGQKKKWSTVQLHELESTTLANFCFQRQLCTQLCVEVEGACALFLKHSDANVESLFLLEPPEMDFIRQGLREWEESDVEALAGHLGAVCLLLGALSKLGGYALEEEVSTYLKWKRFRVLMSWVPNHNLMMVLCFAMIIVKGLSSGELKL
jgi:hypothetical protein